MTDIARALTSRYGASVRRSRAERSAGFRAIAATSATARSKTADRYDGSRVAEFGSLQHGNLMAQRDRFEHQRGAGSEFASGDRDGSAGRRGHDGKLSPDERNQQ